MFIFIDFPKYAFYIFSYLFLPPNGIQKEGLLAPPVGAVGGAGCEGVATIFEVVATGAVGIIGPVYSEKLGIASTTGSSSKLNVGGLVIAIGFGRA